MTNPVDYRCSQDVLPMGRALCSQWDSGSRNLPPTEVRRYRRGQPMEYRAPAPLLSVEALTMQSYVPIHSFNKVCYILYITFYLLSFFTESFFNTLGGCVSANQLAPTRSPTSQTRTTRFIFTEHSRVRPGTTLCHPN